MEDADHFVSRNEVPILQNVSFENRKEARNIKRGKINLSCCRKCGFIFNSAFKDIIYTQTYENDQSYSHMFAKHVENLAVKVSKVINSLKGTVKIVEIGCGQGNFLKILSAQLSPDVEYQAIGFDPAYRSKDDDFSEHLNFVSDYFSKKYIAQDKFDNLIIIARHVIEHISNMHNFFSDFMGSSICESRYLFLETPDFDWILENTSFEDIVYEHCSFFNSNSIKYLLERYGCEFFHIEKVFHGQYMWIEAKFQAGKRNQQILEYQKKEAKFIDKWKTILANAHKKGSKLLIWGAGAKGVAFANLLDPNCLYIDAVVDINPKKAGRFLPGSGHRIISPEECVKSNPDQIIIMNRNYYEEIRLYINDKISRNRNLEIMNM